MSAPDIIHELVNRFRDSYDFYTSANYNEAQLRQEFINPFFEALGWDMTNKAGYAPQYREVIHEDSQKQSDGKTKAPDYAFRIGPSRIFFLEAKKPHTKIKIESDPAFQLRRYGWNAHMSLSILTNFDKFAVYDCRTRPNEKDSPATWRVLFFSFEDYLEKWDEIVSIFSKEAVLKGAFDRFAEDKKGKKGTTEVDSEFLKEIEKWRDKLARNIANRNFSRASNNQITNHHQAERNLNYAVQTTIDRILFLRICEDRKIEPENQLFEIANGKDIYANLLILFQKADQKYNSGLFHFSTEKNQTSEPDSFTPSLKIDDEVLREIIKTTYYPCPYIFNEIAVEILGQVYEQFLGSVIRLTPAGMAKVEEKPEVRKAGGVYYTPRYIVDYIVQNTIGKLLNPESQNPTNESGKGQKALNPEQALKIRIVDPACGSGSFLLGAYQFLLDYHLSYYLSHEPKNHLKGKSPALVPTDDGGYSLSLEAKKRILTSCIFGVDIDSQAVEVTKLSLLLKLLEGEKGQLSLGIERILPDLGNNIRCGNSLIGWDYFKDQLFADEEEIYRVNPFNWQAAFPRVFADGGFDAVIGNPPYFNVDSTWGKNDPKLDALKRGFPEVYRDKTDILFYFLALGIRIAKNRLGFIISRAFMEAYKADKLRTHILNKMRICEIVDFQDKAIFTGVGISTLILVLEKQPAKCEGKHYRLIDPTQDLTNLASILNNESVFESEPIDSDTFSNKPWTFIRSGNRSLFEKIDKNSVPLGNFMKIGKGMETGANSVFAGRSLDEILQWELKPTQYYKRATNSDIQPFKINDRDEYIIFPNAFKSFKDLHPDLQNYLHKNSVKLKNRAAYKRGNCEWWQFTWPLNYQLYKNKRILCPYLAKSNRFALDVNDEFLSLTDTTVIFDSGQAEDLYYILGILNTDLLTERYKSIGKLKGGGIYEYFWNNVSLMPIKRINFSDQTEIALHDKIVTLAKNIVELQNSKPSTPNAVEMKNDSLYFLHSEIEKEARLLYTQA